MRGKSPPLRRTTLSCKAIHKGDQHVASALPKCSRNCGKHGNKNSTMVTKHESRNSRNKRVVSDMSCTGWQRTKQQRAKRHNAYKTIGVGSKQHRLVDTARCLQ